MIYYNMLEYNMLEYNMLEYNMLEEEAVWLLTLYAKNERSTIPGHELKQIKEAIERG